VSYTNIFGGNEIDPASLSYAAYEFDANLSLVWPFEALDGSEVAANIVDLTATAASLLVSMPNATLASTGQSNLFNNVGSNAVTIVDYSGNTIINIPVGQMWFVYLTGNTTANGTWRVVQYGAGTSSANAATLAGFGLRANITKLDQNIVTTSLLSNYTFTANDRAQLFSNNSGVVTWAFTSAATLGNGWFIYAANSGSGAITLDPYLGQTIDGSATKTLNPGESCIVFSDGANFTTIGYGRSLVNTVSGVAINVAGSGTLTLNATQVAAQVQDYNGALTGNRDIEFNAGVGYWFVWNNTTGAYSMTFKANALDTGVVVSQGSYSILRSNGTSMEVAFTATSGTVTSVGTTAGELTGGPITTTGTLGLANTAVTPGNYGAADGAVIFDVDSKGRLTSASEVAIAITGSQVIDLNSIVAAAVLAAIPVGTVWANHTSTLSTGWLFANGNTIGNAASNATSRANADTTTLYSRLWNSDTNLVIYTSAGVVTTRGASAAADFAANKALALPDYRNRTPFGVDGMGGASLTSRVTVAGSGVDGASLGASGGSQLLASHSHAVTDPGHSHAVTDPTHAHTISQSGYTGNNSGLGGTGGGSSLWQAGAAATGTAAAATGISVNTATTGITTQTAGTGSSANLPPAIMTNFIIKYA
jgi:hypothetical protein